jgi:hypothetical protein
LNKSINIVSFDVPFPPNYGGAIDVFYKIKALNELGIQIYLHTFEYGRGKPNELQNYCEQIYYYKRNSKLRSIFSTIPFIVKTRANLDLIEILNSNNYPILFEGLHTTFPLININYKNRITLVRTHNIEHNYYKGLSKSESNKFKKIYFSSEALKLKYYEYVLEKADFILPISHQEQNYFINKFHGKSIYLPVFHQNSEVNTLLGKGKYALYHGNLGVVDNLKSANYLIKIFAKLNYPLIIASRIIIPDLLKKIEEYPNITFENCEQEDSLKKLILNAHINILPSFQNTGIKLKLINALFNGRFCLVNDKMIKKTGLEELCIIANSQKEFRQKILELSTQIFDNSQIEKRKSIQEKFNNTKTVNILETILNFQASAELPQITPHLHI